MIARTSSDRPWDFFIVAFYAAIAAAGLWHLLRLAREPRSRGDALRIGGHVAGIAGAICVSTGSAVFTISGNLHLRSVPLVLISVGFALMGIGALALVAARIRRGPRSRRRPVPAPPVPGEDPGWSMALRSLVPWLVLFRVTQSVRPGDGLSSLRMIVTALAAALPLFFISFSYVTRWDAGDEGSTPAVLLTYGLVTLVVVAWTQRRPLNMESLETLAASYRSRMFAGILVAESAALVGIVSLFVCGSLWVYFLGLVPGLIGIWMAAPSRRNIAHDQEKLYALGSPLSLTEALMSAPQPGRR